MRILLSSVLLLTFYSTAYATNMTPSSNGGSGKIPGTYSTLVFTLADGDWVDTLELPTTGTDAATITIQSSATYGSTLFTTIYSDYPLPSMPISNGDKVTFTYQASSRQWKINGPRYTPNNNGATIPDLTGVRFARYVMADGDWVPSITFPATAANNTVVVVSSDATYNSQISAQNMLFASTFTIQKGDSYVFSYRTELQHWAPLTTPTRSFVGAQVGADLARPTAPQTLATFTNDSSVSKITLPSVAGDRDRVTISSVADQPKTISNTNIDFSGTLSSSATGTYVFIFIKERNLWILQSNPITTLNAYQLNAGQMPDVTAPVTELISGDGNYTSTVFLPKVAKPGDRVIVRSTATYDFSVKAEAADFTSIPIHTDETVRFVRTSSNQWSTETRIITMLLVYSDAAATRLGESAEQARLLEALRLTNQALENSKVNFYVKSVGMLKRQLAGGTLGAVIDVGRTDTVIQAERDRLKADAVYYEGTEDGCGLAWVNSDAFSMFGGGSLNCGTTVMRHEFGHNMGLGHSDAAGGSATYAKGYSALGIATIMGGNAMGYYSSPRLYTLDLGIPMGIENQVDAARALNERSEAVSKFR